MEFVVAVIIFVLAMVGLTRPFIGLLALLIVMELQPGELYPQLSPFHLERIVAAILLVSFLIHGEKLRFPPPTRWFLAFYGAMILSIPLAFWRANAASTCISFLEIVVFVLFVTALLTTEERIRWFTLTFVLLVDWLGGSALWNYAHGVWFVTMHIERANGITSSAGDPDTLAATLLFSIPLCLVLMARSNPVWMRAIGAGSIGVALVTIVDTGSRAVAAGVVMLALLLVFRKPKNLIYLPVLVALSPVVWMVIPQQYKARYETVNHLKSDDSYQDRVLSWEGGIAMFESNFITGIGAGDYTYANGMKYWPGIGRKHWLNAHSLYFKTLGELGLLGVVTFGGYLICVFRLNFRLKKQLTDLKASHFLQQLPPMSSVIFILLLFDGYAAHNLYRDTWYVIGAMVASVSLLPMLQTQSSPVKLGEGSVETTQATIDAWSPALLPVLRRQAPSAGPRA
jgi:O-antigen ligase